jgi:hypothetical protein
MVPASVERERQAELRRRRWEAAMIKAREQYVLSFRTKELQRQAAVHRAHRELAKHVDAVKLHAERLEPEPAAAAHQWISLAVQHLQATDPLRQPLRLPDAPEPTLSDLQAVPARLERLRAQLTCHRRRGLCSTSMTGWRCSHQLAWACSGRIQRPARLTYAGGSPADRPA